MTFILPATPLPPPILFASLAPSCCSHLNSRAHVFESLPCSPSPDKTRLSSYALSTLYFAAGVGRGLNNMPLFPVWNQLRYRQSRQPARDLHISFVTDEATEKGSVATRACSGLPPKVNSPTPPHGRGPVPSLHCGRTPETLHGRRGGRPRWGWGLVHWGGEPHKKQIKLQKVFRVREEIRTNDIF